MEDRLSLKRMLALSWLYLAVLVAGAWVISSWSFAWGVLAGGIISIVSFLASSRDVEGFFENLETTREQPAQEIKQIKKGLIVKFWLRLLLIGLVLLVLIKYSSINVFGLILGLTTVVFTITVSAVGAAWGYYFRRR
ncbi:MAG: ATP synthase subunit I [Desulfofustis sp.]|nr:ATP synthase subunit I [Desulfofustis sp.]